MLLAGDVGGTKILLGLFEADTTRPHVVAQRTFSTSAHANLNDVIARFLSTAPAGTSIDRVAIGVAGPVRDQAAQLTNVPWHVSASELRQTLSVDAVALLNDVEAMAYSVEVLGPDEMCPLQRGEADVRGNGALISVGTGVGMAVLHRVNGRFVPLATEGGHVDFAARTDREIELMRSLRDQFGRVDVERVVAGQGLALVARFTHGGVCPKSPPELSPADEPAHVTTTALNNACDRCRDALELFVGALGAVVGNLGLAANATGGIFIGGGVPSKILPALSWPGFLAAMRDKAPLGSLVSAIPVTVVTLPEAGLLGAAVYANRLSG